MRESHTDVLTSTVENCRWLVTLVLGEMAGFVAYRSNVVKIETLGPAFAIVVIMLGISLVAFVASVLRARFKRRGYEQPFVGVLGRLTDLAKTLSNHESKASVDKTHELFAKREEEIEKLPSTLGRAGYLELGGVLLGLGSCIAAATLFLGEILALFGKT